MATFGFGERLRELLEERDMTQAELSRTLHLGKSTVSQYISGARTPDLTTLNEIADFFRVSLDYLLGRSALPQPGVVKEPDVEAVVRRLGRLDPEDRRKVLNYVEFLRYERRRRGSEPSGDTEA